ncbi:LOW QUALITY PROTEIN: uncharacterized protein Dsimw501_GD27808 [Drosophila simulans]|uniref:Uncharacterized protein n=1 Tax=Drosophila simulans TaxID=7240 RepID=A0A0J9R738_DROSI|nr:LOW QUALITY PROTEIN: uncharacterized protein Dsimw501_GD27808 [Drosophila simulans]
MCCLLEHIFKILVFIFAIFINFLVAANLVLHFFYIRFYGPQGDKGYYKLNLTLRKYMFYLFGTVFTSGIENYYLLWTMQSWCGTLMVVIKFKDLCYLQWWLLMTSTFILAGLVLHLILFDFQGEHLGTNEKVHNYFGIGLMLVSLLTVASYSRTLRPPEESDLLFKATTN